MSAAVKARAAYRRWRFSTVLEVGTIRLWSRTMKRQALEASSVVGQRGGMQRSGQRWLGRIATGSESSRGTRPARSLRHSFFKADVKKAPKSISRASHKETRDVVNADQLRSLQEAQEFQVQAK